MGLVDRAFLVSHPKFHDKNLFFVINILLENSYPLQFIRRIFLRYLKFLIHNRDFHPTIPSPSSSESNKFFAIPFIKDISQTFRSIIHDNYGRLAFTVKNNLNDLIKLHKDPLPKMNHANVIYKISCKDCDASYVGQMGRRLATRLKKHKSITNYSSDFNTVVASHRLLGHDFNCDDTTILDEEPFYRKRLVSEMLHISQQSNGLNLNNDTSLLDHAYLPMIKKYLKFSKSPAPLLRTP